MAMTTRIVPAIPGVPFGLVIGIDIGTGGEIGIMSASTLVALNTATVMTVMVLGMMRMILICSPLLHNGHGLCH